MVTEDDIMGLPMQWSIISLFVFTASVFRTVTKQFDSSNHRELHHGHSINSQDGIFITVMDHWWLWHHLRGVSWLAILWSHCISLSTDHRNPLISPWKRNRHHSVFRADVFFSMNKPHSGSYIDWNRYANFLEWLKVIRWFLFLEAASVALTLSTCDTILLHYLLKCNH